jgi:hypothetical protein
MALEFPVVLESIYSMTHDLEFWPVLPRLCTIGMPLYQKDLWVYVMLPGTDLKTRQFDPEKQHEKDFVA